MSTHIQVSLSEIRTMILCEYPLSTEEYGHLYYDGCAVTKNIEEAYVWCKVAQFAGNHNEDSLVNYLGSTLVKPKCLKLSSRAKPIYTRALQH